MTALPNDIPMALHELHARRLATVINMVEAALDRFEVVLRGIDNNPEPSGAELGLSAEQVRQIHERMESIRGRLKQAGERFAIERTKPEPRQVLAAELSTLWVMLENAMPKRMKGYGRELAAEDKSDWESLVHGLLREVDQIRKVTLKKEPAE
jgi:hypothetical protein